MSEQFVPTDIKVALVRTTGSQWTPEQKEEAYQLYRTDRKDGGAGRSLRRLAEITGINIGTIAMWSRTLGWQQRMMEDDGRDAELRHQTAKMKLINELDPLIDNMVDIAFHAQKDRDRIEAGKFLLQLMGYSPIQKIQQDIFDGRMAKGGSAEVRDLKATPLDELARIVNQALPGDAGESIQDVAFTDVAEDSPEL